MRFRYPTHWWVHLESKCVAGWQRYTRLLLVSFDLPRYPVGEVYRCGYWLRPSSRAMQELRQPERRYHCHVLVWVHNQDKKISVCLQIWYDGRTHPRRAAYSTVSRTVNTPSKASSCSTKDIMSRGLKSAESLSRIWRRHYCQSSFWAEHHLLILWWL